jgi:DNA-binding XRE family transcriptional regulator/DNA-binding transcriptional ArsR family regulator
MTPQRRNAWLRADAGGRPHAELAWSRALAHPVRVEILRALVEREPGSPSGFATTLGIPLGVASHHVRRLRDLHLIHIARRTHRRGAVQHHYRLVDRDATAQALWRWGFVPGDEPPHGAGADANGGSAAGRETMRRVVDELRRRRERQGLSRTMLAQRVGISVEALGRIERGEADPRMSIVLALAGALGTSLRELFAEAETVV